MAAVRTTCCPLNYNEHAARLPTNRKCCDVDGPYAWLIALASFFAHFFIYGVVYCSGVFYEMFREIFDGSSSMISLIATLSTAFTFGFSPIPGILMNKYGQRMMTIVGGLVAGTGIILSAYATNVYFMAVTFGVITGIGFGTSYLAVVSIVALYFDEYRSIAYGLVSSGAGLGTFVYPPIIRLLVNAFGDRGALLIIGGATLNICVCGAVMRPPRRRVGSKAPGRETESRKSGPWGGSSPGPNNGSSNSNNSNNNSRLASLNLHMFKNCGYLVLCLNNFLAMFGLSIVYVHLAAYSIARDADRDSAAMLVSVLGISTFVGHPSFGLLGRLRRRGPLTLYAASFTLSGLVVLTLPLVAGFPGLAAAAAVFGFLISCFGPLLPQIITELLSVDLLPAGYGYLMVFEAVGSLLGPPAAGWLFDVLRRYAPSFYLSGTALALSGMIMFLPYFRRRQPAVVGETDIIHDDTEDTKEILLSSGM